MAGLLTELRTLVDVVVVDAPPVLPVTDAVVLGAQADAVVLVLRAGRTTADTAEEARKRLDGVGARVIGVVLNAGTLGSAAATYAPGRGREAASGSPS